MDGELICSNSVKALPVNVVVITSFWPSDAYFQTFNVNNLNNYS